MRTWALILPILFVFMACDEVNTGSDTCGDGVVDTGEECDGESLGSNSCEAYHGGEPVCKEDCTIDMSPCQATGYCGDGIIQNGAEECDGDTLGEVSCQNLGYTSGTLSCSEQCTYETSACSTCGDSVVGGEEQCDRENLNGSTCKSLFYNGGNLLCDDQCHFDVSGCEPYGKCPDGTIQTPYEECDGIDLNGETCSSLGYYGGQLQCSQQCEFDESSCQAVGMCGDNLIQEVFGESCDGTEFGGVTCEIEGHVHGGTLLCDQSCQIPSENCHYFYDVSFGAFHGCGLLYTGDIVCWGDNTWYVLGDNGLSESLIPVAVEAQGVMFTSIAVHNYHSCALDGAGQAFCWGSNQSGRLGDGTLIDRELPTPVAQGNVIFTKIAPGVEHACALADSGQVYCWGIGDNGQLGDGESIISNVPIPVAQNDVAYIDISVGWFNVCALSASGQAYCWGINDHGQLGDGTTTTSSTPVMVHQNGETYVKISTYYNHTCAVGVSGDAYCWGLNDHGQLGDGSITDSATPVPVAQTGIAFNDIGAGFSHSCGLGGGGVVYCWGINTNGELGQGSFTLLESHTPLQISATRSYTKLVVSYFGTMVIDDHGNVFGCGNNDYPRLGDGSKVSKAALTPVAPW